MRNWVRFGLFQLCAMAMAGICLASAAPDPGKLNLRVLFVGGSGERNTSFNKALVGFEAKERKAAFAALLRDHFTHVTVMEAKDYRQEASRDFDVTVIDGTPVPLEAEKTVKDAAGEIQSVTPARYFTEDFDRPVLLVAELSEELGRRIGLKFDWYCLCLSGYAHSMRLDHPIFHGPFPVKLTLQERPTPAAAFEYEYFRGTPTPKTLSMWQVQTRDCNTKVDDQAPGLRIGMVARPWGFEDSPDAEAISGGACLKTLDAVALARHGNFFSWGFAASPRDMTEEAKTVFANAVAYIAKFQGQGLMARKYDSRRATKDYVKELKYFSTRASYDAKLQMIREADAEVERMKKEALVKQGQGKPLNDNEKWALEFVPGPVGSFESSLQDLQPELYARFGTDLAAYARYYDGNYDYFYSVAPFYRLIVDEDVKSLAIPNTDPRILDRAISLWERGEDVAKAKRILTRYTLLDFPNPAQWRTWFDQNRSRLYFTQAGGFVFMVNTRDPKVPGNDYHRAASPRVEDGPAQGQPSAPAPEATTIRNPIAISAGFESGSGKRLVIRIKVHPGFHIYGEVGPSDPFLTTRLDVELPAAYHLDGAMRMPPAHPMAPGSATHVYTDEMVISQSIKGEGTGNAKITLSYQACDDHICNAPAQKVILVPLP